MMKNIKVKQLRSQIGCPKTQKRVMESLGLRKIGQEVEHQANPVIMGMVNKVKHLISVQEIK